MMVKVDKLGRVVLPKSLRARYGLRPGTALEISEGAQEFVLRPALNGPDWIDTQGVWVHQGVPVGKLDFAQVIRQDREERLARTGG